MGLFEESGRNVERTGTLLRELMAEYPERSALARDILICEQEGDRITHDIIHRLSSNGTKLERGDAYELARLWTTWSITRRRPPTRSSSTRSRPRWCRPRS